MRSVPPWVLGGIAIDTLVICAIRNTLVLYSAVHCKRIKYHFRLIPILAHIEVLSSSLMERQLNPTLVGREMLT